MTTSIFRILKLRGRPYHFVLGAVAVAGVLYFLPKVIGLGDRDGFGLDFRVIWLAGKIWASGQNPYGPVFLDQYLANFGPHWDAYWFYPPNWYPLAVSFGFLPFPASNLLWNGFNSLLLMTATHLVARTLADLSGQKYLPIFLIGIAYVCFMQAAEIAIYIGQTSILIYFGFSAIFFGLLKERLWVLIVGLVFVALKPQIGIVAIVAMAALGRYRWTLLPAAGIGLLSIVPINFGGDLRISLGQWLANLSLFSNAMPGSNSPANLTGLINILDYLSFSSIKPFVSTIILVLAAIVGGFAAFLLSPLNGAPETDADNARYRVISFALLIGITFFVVPLHPYDHVTLAALIMMLVAFRFAGRWLILLGLLGCIRPHNLYSVLSITNPASQNFRESFLMSVALLLIFLGLIWSILHQPAESLPLPEKSLREPR